MKSIFKIIWKTYNFLVNIFGHICVLALLVAFGYYLHTKDLLYLVLLCIIVILILSIVILCINASIAKKKLNATKVDTKDLKKSADKLKSNIK